MKKYQNPALIVVGASLLLSIIHCPLFNIFYDDKEIFKYTGYVILKGGVPYQNFFDHKPPLIFFLNWGGLLMGKWGLWLLDILMVLYASLLFYKISKSKLGNPWLLPLLFNLLLRVPFISNGIGMTREYTTIFLLIFFCFLLMERKYKYFWLGLITALIFFMQQDQIITLLPLFIYGLLVDLSRSWIKVLVRRSAAMLLGFLVITLPIICYFQWHHALTDFWSDAFLFNFAWYTEKVPLQQNVKSIFVSMRNGGYELAFYVSLILGIASLILGNTNKKLLIACLFALFLSFSAEYVSGKLVLGLDVYYYLLPLAATMPMLLYAVYTNGEPSPLQNKVNQLIYGMIFAAAPLLQVGGYSLGILKRGPSWFEVTPAVQYFKDLPLHDYDLYVFSSSQAVFLYNQHHILAPSKWIYHYFWHWYKNWDPHHEILQSITDDLMKHKTTYVLDYSDSTTFKNKDNYQYWKSFLENHYASTHLDSGRVQVWKMK
ncbi:MAG: hypothetical protein ACHQET_00645 [Chitinophagales bacterium]